MSESPNASALGQALGKMTDREKKLVGLTVVVALVLVVAGVFFFVGNAVKAREKNIAAKREWLASAESLRAEYAAAVARQEAADRRIQQASSTSLSATVRNAAVELGIPVTDMQERTLPVKDSEMSEVSVDLNVKELSIDRLVQLLEKIEGRNAGSVVKVQKLKVKTKLDNPEMLEANIGVSTWKAPPKAATPAGATGAADGEKKP